MKRHYGIQACAVAVAGILAFGAPSEAQAEYYEGKTLEIIVGFASGGTDTAARIIARRMQKYIPGQPNVIVTNMPGGGSLKAQNFVFERAKPDGMTIGFNPFQVMAQITEREGVRFSYPDFTFIGGVKGPSFVVVARNDISPGGLNAPGDIAKINKPLSYSGRNPLHTIDVVSTLSLDVLGLDYTYVAGFRGSAELTTSMAQDETNITGAASIHWLNHLVPRLVSAGDVKALYQFGVYQPDGSIKPDPLYENVPLFADYYQQAKGSAPSGELYEAFQYAEEMQGIANFLFLGPPNMNPEATEILRKAVEQAMADPETIAEAKKTVIIPYNHIGYDRAKSVMDKLRDTSAEMKEFWKQRTARQSGN